MISPTTQIFYVVAMLAILVLFLAHDDIINYIKEKYLKPKE